MDEDYNHIERYLRGEMDDEEATAFEKRIKDDPALQESFRNEQLLVQSLRIIHEKNRLRSFEDDISNATDAPQGRIVELNRWRTPLAIAASLSLIIATAAIFYLNRPGSEYMVGVYVMEGVGFAGDEKIGEMQVMVEVAKGEISYQFDDILVLSLDNGRHPEELRLYKKSTGEWWLQINDEYFELKRDGQEHFLK